MKMAKYIDKVDIIKLINDSFFDLGVSDDRMNMLTEVDELPTVEIIHCKDCKYFEYDHPYVVYGVPVLGHLICNKWGDGCRTDENGFCFMAERREDG